MWWCNMCLGGKLVGCHIYMNAIFILWRCFICIRTLTFWITGAVDFSLLVLSVVLILMFVVMLRRLFTSRFNTERERCFTSCSLYGVNTNVKAHMLHKYLLIHVASYVHAVHFCLLFYKTHYLLRHILLLH